MTTAHPEPERDIDDYEAEFQKLDKQIEEAEKNPAPSKPKSLADLQVRVQFRGIADKDGNPFLQIMVDDKIVHIEAKNLMFLTQALPSIGSDGNTLVTWGYLPTPDEG